MFTCREIAKGCRSVDHDKRETSLPTGALQSTRTRVFRSVHCCRLVNALQFDPDDMLSVQEGFMASEGMDTYSVCPTCQAKGLHVLSTSAIQQKFGNPNRAFRFFCEQRQSVRVCDEPAVTPLPPSSCLIPKQVMDAMRRIPAGSLPLINRLNRTIDFEALERRARRQPNNKAPGEDGQPREFCKHGPTELLELYWKATNCIGRRLVRTYEEKHRQ